MDNISNPTTMKSFKNYSLNEETLNPSDLKIIVLTAAEEDEEPTVNSLEDVCKKQNIELYRIVSNKAYASKKDELKEILVIHNYDGDGKSLEIKRGDNVLCIARRTAATSKNAAILHSMLSDHGIFCINSPESVKTASNKFNSYINFVNDKVPTPKTCLVSDIEYIDKAVEEVGGKFPLVLKVTEGHGGKGVMKIDSRESLVSVIQAMRGDDESSVELILQELKSIKDDRRILVLNGKAIAGSKRKKMSGDFRTNVSLGSAVEAYNPTEEEIELAIKAAKSVDCFYCGVDIIQSNGKYYVLEVNPSPGSKASYFDIEKGKNITGTQLIGKLINCILDKDCWSYQTKQVGVLEYMSFLNPSVGPLTAKMDTGNGSKNSVGVTDLKIKGNKVEFYIQGTDKKMVKDLLPKLSVIKRRGEKGNPEKRPMVLFDVKLGDRVYRDITFSLADRSNMDHPILVSADFMSGCKLSVDPNKEFTCGTP